MIFSWIMKDGINAGLLFCLPEIGNKKYYEELQKRKITVNELMRMKAEVLIRDAGKSEKTETGQE